MNSKLRRETLNPNDTEVSRISPDKIDKNPENPRLVFNQTELDALLESIGEVGIQVPLTVFRSSKNSGRYVILDGERRWRCAQKLNLSDIPALIRSEPSALENILIMFNIHNVRENWALLPTALKLRQIRDIIEKDQPGKIPSDGEISTMTGVRPAQVKRAFELLELPQSDLDRLMSELEKPRRDQKISEDFYIEALRATKTIERHKPEVFKEFGRNNIVQALVKKYDDKVIKNLVELRDISRIARADVNLNADSEVVEKTLRNLISTPSEKISDSYEKAAASLYYKRDITRKLKDILQEVDGIGDSINKEDEIYGILVSLKGKIDKLLAENI